MGLIAQPLTAEGFAPFGRVLDAAGSAPVAVNQGRALRRNLATFSGCDARFVLARYDVVSSSLPLDIPFLERHALSDQSFVPLESAVALIVVAPTAPDGAPALARARAFIAGPQTPFLYAAGTWHAPLFALGAGGAFLMGMHESGTPADCDTCELTTPLRVESTSWDAGIG